MIDLKFNYEGLVPCVVVDDQTKDTLMVAYMNEEALNLTLETGRVTFYSRSRSKIWVKGETSGNFLMLKKIVTDCDQDTLLAYVVPKGPVCHTGSRSCFQEVIYDNDGGAKPSSEAEMWKNEGIVKQVAGVIRGRRLNPVEGSYTNYLLDKGIDKILKKVGEEATEIIIGAKNNADEIVFETADLLYHLLVLYENEGVSFSRVFDVLEKRYRT